MNLVEVLRAVQEAADTPGSFAVIGAVARNAWAPPRATTDLDLAVLADGGLLERMQIALGRLGYRLVREQRADPADSLPDIEVFRSEDAELRQIDLLIAKTEFERSVLGRAAQIDVGPIVAPVASPEDLIVYKLLADRPRDRDDVSAVIRTLDRAAKTPDWDYIERWARFWQIEDRLERLRRQVAD